MKTLYFDCFSGISGDMVIGALIDAGADPNLLAEELKKLQIEDEYELKWKKIIKNGISSTKFDVVLLNNSNNQNNNHEHTEDHSHGHEHEHHHDHSHIHEHEHHHHHHHHSHDHDHHHQHDHRAYKEIVELIEGAGFSDSVKETALKIFNKIGEAEGLIHGIPLENVHFHEVGAVDSIIDIIGAAILIDQLEIDIIKSSAIPVGTGRIHIDHGVYPVPAPATLEILKGVPLDQSDIRAELTTPTGAAIVAVLAEEYCSIPSLKVRSIGYGAGTKTFKHHPNVLRVIIGEQ
ncbi:LarC family nickel insertion protein [Neobacillus sp. OS1-2]|uniref:LarC family nickel insertion protein n=1 Tax=Neobacillus sp. OS1-2 TaxID=3070680 RepID=UPI0027DFC08E|nr:LarC family nickel insertion protein [Neobacillus sp. OS1-2]WML38577.1 LarC family nickel insertion protein [Neobacillus sp. OS1-2]